jgi:hypothetical protein
MKKLGTLQVIPAKAKIQMSLNFVDSGSPALDLAGTTKKIGWRIAETSSKQNK